MHYEKGIGYVEMSGKKVCSARQMALRLARVYGFENDTKAFTRLIIESRVNRQAMLDAWAAGRKLAESQSVQLTTRHP